MHATQLLNNYLYNTCQSVHKRRLQSLMASVRAVMFDKTLSVTGIGRAIQSDTTQKHNIKRADRLIGKTDRTNRSNKQIEDIHQIIDKIKPIG